MRGFPKRVVSCKIRPLNMGATPGKALMTTCMDSPLACAVGEPQEICVYGGASTPGHRPGMPCDWGNLSSFCTSQLDSCACPQFTAGMATSALPRYTEAPGDALMVFAGPFMLWSLTLLVVPLYKLLPSWTRTWKLPRAMATDVSSKAVRRWFGLCAAGTAGLVAVSLLPAHVWGECSQRGVCVYHMMFCEATRHHSAIRHPANFWSNLPYVYAALGFLCLAIDERARRVSRPYQLLDATFALVLLGMAIASFGWHGTNCTEVHFLDIALMNCVIAFFPYRFGASSLVAACGANETSLSTAVAAGAHTT